LNGTAGDDLFAGLAGHDRINGGAGQDTAWYAGLMAGYRFAAVGGKLQVRDINAADGADGTDLLSDIETLQLGNGQLSVSPIEFRVNTVTESDQRSPTITALHDGGFVVSWESNGQDGSEYGIYAKR
jgi:Ca2+-binding RTX toxin-like protein